MVKESFLGNGWKADVLETEKRDKKGRECKRNMQSKQKGTVTRKGEETPHHSLTAYHAVQSVLMSLLGHK